MKTTTTPRETKPVFLLWGTVLTVILLIGLFLFFSGNLSGFLGFSSASPKPSVLKEPSQYLSRQVYFQEAFIPDRTNYDLFEAAAEHTGLSVSEMPRYFNVKNEEDIFAALPAVPSDFSEIAYLLATGKFFSIKNLGEGYWKQPEFYPNFTNLKGGLRWWRGPDPTSWGSNGYGVYPQEQWATLTRGDTEAFEATIFLYSSWGVQTFQGVTLFADPRANDYFDLEISPQTFVLEPSFPKFYPNWATKITIKGRLKEGVLPGEYPIGVTIGVPPQEKVTEWQTKYRNLYENAASSVRPSGNTIDLHIKVE